LSFSTNKRRRKENTNSVHKYKSLVMRMPNGTASLDTFTISFVNSSRVRTAIVTSYRTKKDKIALTIALAQHL